MQHTDEARFASFARDFVTAYWQTVKSGIFPTPTDEPVDETIDELLSAISHTTEVGSSSGRSGAFYKLRMTNEHGDWWLFTFRERSARWTLIGCSARSDDDSHPHDLLGPTYSEYFRPFLQHALHAARAQSRL